MKNILYILSIFSLLNLSCEDVIELDVPEGRIRLIVDGLVSDGYDVQTVKLNYTSPYFENEATPPATGAIVMVQDDLGQKFTLNENTEDSAGVYTYRFTPQVGRSYSLYVKTADGEEYETAMQEMQPVGSLDTLFYEFQEKSRFVEEEGFVAIINCSDIDGVKNYYRWRYFVNGEYKNEVDNLFFANDELVDGSSGLSIRFRNNLLQVGDIAKVEQMSISKEAYQFLYLLSQQTQTSNPLFSTPPAPIKGNVRNLKNGTNDALGFFMVSSIVSREVEISSDGFPTEE